MIDFFFEDIKFEVNLNFDNIRTWIKETIINESCELKNISYVFCSDAYLIGINNKYLKHDYYTDIITFPYSKYPVVDCDIFISMDRVKENSKKFSVAIKDELLRVIIHGIVHLVGYNDETEDEKKTMRNCENKYLKKFS